MLGGQYWGIYYSSEDTPDDPDVKEATIKGCYFWKEPNGNNYYATKRISKDWFFFYMDYDGNRHKLNWKAE